MIDGIIAEYKLHKEQQKNMSPYKIKAAIDQSGMPIYELRVVLGAFVEEVIATNADRAVLERAIEHLQSN